MWVYYVDFIKIKLFSSLCMNVHRIMWCYIKYINRIFNLIHLIVSRRWVVDEIMKRLYETGINSERQWKGEYRLLELFSNEPTPNSQQIAWKLWHTLVENISISLSFPLALSILFRLLIFIRTAVNIKLSSWAKQFQHFWERKQTLGGWNTSAGSFCQNNRSACTVCTYTSGNYTI